MSKWEKISIFDANDYRCFFNEKYGLITNISIDLRLADKNGNVISFVYAKENIGGNLERIRNFNINTFFKTKFYKLNNTNQRVYYERISLDNAEPIEDYKCSVTVEYDYFGYFEEKDRYNKTSQKFSSRKVSETIIVSNENEFKNFIIWATKDDAREYVCPIFMNLKEDQKYYYVTKGTCVVNKVYEWKDEDAPICNVVFADGFSDVDIVPGDIRFVEIPMDYKSELDIFNESKNELFLQPLVKTVSERNLINIMWQPIEDAARYIIRLYRVRYEKRGQKAVYFLKDYEVDRNEHWLTIPNIIIDNHVVVITAENRLGETIAKSKGINVASGKFVGVR